MNVNAQGEPSCILHLLFDGVFVETVCLIRQVCFYTHMSDVTSYKSDWISTARHSLYYLLNFPQGNSTNIVRRCCCGCDVDSTFTVDHYSNSHLGLDVH